ncbi:hypothetical protein [Kocuria sp.]|uniref:hypothetical protein n=1 Tax=Kocuria sp. TaxID=1871328 RepID=UPI0026DBAB29|nr:hypothetical protein [Kocuria sp.]MDO4919927.1 hypothetical protein [Kocuria sp.]
MSTSLFGKITGNVLDDLAYLVARGRWETPPHLPSQRGVRWGDYPEARRCVMVATIRKELEKVLRPAVTDEMVSAAVSALRPHHTYQVENGEAWVDMDGPLKMRDAIEAALDAATYHKENR